MNVVTSLAAFLSRKDWDQVPGVFRVDKYPTPYAAFEAAEAWPTWRGRGAPNGILPPGIGSVVVFPPGQWDLRGPIFLKNVGWVTGYGGTITSLRHLGAGDLFQSVERLAQYRIMRKFSGFALVKRDVEEATAFHLGSSYRPTFEDINFWGYANGTIFKFTNATPEDQDLENHARGTWTEGGTIRDVYGYGCKSFIDLENLSTEPLGGPRSQSFGGMNVSGVLVSFDQPDSIAIRVRHHCLLYASTLDMKFNMHAPGCVGLQVDDAGTAQQNRYRIFCEGSGIVPVKIAPGGLVHGQGEIVSMDPANVCDIQGRCEGVRLLMGMGT